MSKKRKLSPKLRVWPKGVGGTEDSTDGLIQLCDEWITEEMVGAEIGCFAGVSTEVFANYAKRIYAIDPWDMDVKERGYNALTVRQLKAARKKFMKMAKKYEDKIITLETRSVEASVILERVLDFVYIDGAHDKANAVIDILLWGERSDTIR